MKHVEIAIIGAGSAGLYALSQVQKLTDSYVLINGGPYGTTCARVGCMPSKALIQIAEDYHRRESFEQSGIRGSAGLQIDIPTVLAKVRSYRDRFVGALIKHTIEPLGDKKIEGYARFLQPDLLEVNGERIRAGKVIIATGSTPVIPKPWKEFGERILTTDELFEQENLPARVGVIGLGAIGLEIGQSLGRLGLDVHGYDHGQQIGGLSDQTVADKAYSAISRDFKIHLGESVDLSLGEDGIIIKSSKEEQIVDKVIASLGRRPNIDMLGLEALDLVINEKGIPDFNPETMQIEDLPIFIAGDVNTYRPILHEAGEEGRIAGYNAMHTPQRFKRKTPMGIVFSDPNIAYTGQRFKEIQQRGEIVIGEFDMAKLGRAIVMQKDTGLIRIYADKKSGKLLGTEMAIVSGEHIVHELAWAIEQEFTVFDLIKMPFYHPVIEEGLQYALMNAINQIERETKTPVELKTLS